MGRAARHINGRAILYADKTTFSMTSAINEINRRRKIQEAYNKKHGITPQGIQKAIADSRMAGSKKEIADEEARKIDPATMTKVGTGLYTVLVLCAIAGQWEAIVAAAPPSAGYGAAKTTWSNRGSESVAVARDSALAMVSDPMEWPSSST